MEYVALLFAAVSPVCWACAVALDSAGSHGMLCCFTLWCAGSRAAALDKITWYVALIFAPLCCAWTADLAGLLRAWPGALLLLPVPKCCPVAALNLRSRPLFPLIWPVIGQGQHCPCPFELVGWSSGWARAHAHAQHIDPQ